MPEAKCPYFSSVNPIIPKGSCFMLREKVATWSPNVGPVQLLFALYVKSNGGGAGRVGRWQLTARILWYRRRGYKLLAFHTTEAHNCLWERCSPWLCSSSRPGSWARVLGHLSCIPRGADGMAGIAHGADVLQARVTCRTSPGVQCHFTHIQLLLRNKGLTL